MDHRRGAGTGVVAAVLTALALLIPAPAQADDSGQLRGTFELRYQVHRNPHMPAEFRPGSKAVTWTFGAGCAEGGPCAARRLDGDGQAVTLTGGAAQGLTHRSSQVLDCIDPASGAVKTPGGANLTVVTRLVPSATEVRGGETWVTALRGTSDSELSVNAKGRADDCSIPPERSLVEREHAEITGTLVPLVAAPPRTSTEPLGVADAQSPRAGSMPAFVLPQTGRERDSARAVAAGRRSSVPGALVAPRDALATVGRRLPKDLLLVALLGLLMVFPAQVFNSTYEENHERIDRRLARLRGRRTRETGPPAAEGETVGRPPPRGRRLVVFLVCVLAGTMLAGLLDPGFGADRASYALLVGVFLSVLLAVLVAALAAREFRSVTRRDHDWYLRAIPSALAVAVLCVVVSRLTHFEPGYLYGVLGGALFAAALDRRDEGRAEVVVAVTGLVLALAAWVAFGPVADAANGAEPSFAVLGLDAFLSSLFVGGVEGLLLGLVPLRFLPGHRIKSWSWVAWGVLTALVLYVFVHVLLLPESGYLGRSTEASVTLTLVLFGCFAAGSAVFWLYFRLRPTLEPADPSPPADTALTPEPVA